MSEAAAAAGMAIRLAQANPVKHRLLAGEPCCLFAVRAVRHAGIVALAQAAGYHGLYIDLQHSPIGLEAAAGIFQGAAHAGLTALARLPRLDPALIGRVIDAGSHGVMLADVRSAAQARDFAAAALLAPLGERSMGLPVDPRFPGLGGPSLALAINRATLLVAMIESEEGVRQAADIAATPGIDALQVGSADLSAAMGIPGQYAHPRLLEACGRIAAAAQASGKPFIVGGMRKAEELAPLLAMGAASCFFTGSDTAFVLDGARAARERMEAAGPAGRPQTA